MRRTFLACSDSGASDRFASKYKVGEWMLSPKTQYNPRNAKSYCAEHLSRHIFRRFFDYASELSCKAMRCSGECGTSASFFVFTMIGQKMAQTYWFAVQFLIDPK